MLAEIYIQALSVDKELADQVWEAWDKGVISDFWAAWWAITVDLRQTRMSSTIVGKR
jgi:hypothetical protein